jgi:hypothetical protein
LIALLAFCLAERLEVGASNPVFAEKPTSIRAKNSRRWSLGCTGDQVAAHRHQGSVYDYVLWGAIRSEIRNPSP